MTRKGARAPLGRSLMERGGQGQGKGPSRLLAADPVMRAPSPNFLCRRIPIVDHAEALYLRLGAQLERNRRLIPALCAAFRLRVWFTAAIALPWV